MSDHLSHRAAQEMASSTFKNVSACVNKSWPNTLQSNKLSRLIFCQKKKANLMTTQNKLVTATRFINGETKYPCLRQVSLNLEVLALTRGRP